MLGAEGDISDPGLTLRTEFLGDICQSVVNSDIPSHLTAPIGPEWGGPTLKLETT